MSLTDTLDLVWGAEQIALLINRSKREVFYLLATHQLNGARKIGGRWCIPRQVLMANFHSSMDSTASVDARLFAKFDALMQGLPPEEQKEVLEYWT